MTILQLAKHTSCSWVYLLHEWTINFQRNDFAHRVSQACKVYVARIRKSCIHSSDLYISLVQTGHTRFKESIRASGKRIDHNHSLMILKNILPLPSLYNTSLTSSRCFWPGRLTTINDKTAVHKYSPPDPLSVLLREPDLSRRGGCLRYRMICPVPSVWSASIGPGFKSKNNNHAIREVPRLCRLIIHSRFPFHHRHPVIQFEPVEADRIGIDLELIPVAHSPSIIYPLNRFFHGIKRADYFSNLCVFRARCVCSCHVCCAYPRC